MASVDVIVKREHHGGKRRLVRRGGVPRTIGTACLRDGEADRRKALCACSFRGV
jgi:hypothetical protein